jgi:hypothetical protein
MSEGTSGSREQGSYQLLPPTARNDTRASDTVQSGLLIEDKIKNTRESRHLIKHWRWETFTFLLGTAAFTTILALLLQFRDKEIWDWDLSGIQITAIVAALAQVAQSAFLVPISYCIGQLKW